MALVWMGVGAQERIPDFRKVRLLGSTLRLEEFHDAATALETMPSDETVGRQIIRGEHVEECVSAATEIPDPPFFLPSLVRELVAWAIRTSDIGRDGGGNGLTVHISGTTLNAQKKESTFADLIAYNHHIRWGNPTDDSRNAPPGVWMSRVQEIDVRSLRGWMEFITTSASPGYDKSDPQKCMICDQGIMVPVPNRMYTQGGFTSVKKTGGARYFRSNDAKI